MIDKFIPWQMLQVAWDMAPRISFLPGDDQSYQWKMVGKPNIHDESMSDSDKMTTMMQLYTLHRFMKKGPVVIIPPLNLANALLDTEIRVPVGEYQQPYEVMGVLHDGRMTLVWRPNQHYVVAWTMTREGLTYWLSAGPKLPTIEDQLAQEEGVESDDDRKIGIQGLRMAVNACFLASKRATAVTPLPDLIKKHRQANNAGLRRAAFQEFQELRFTDLMLQPRPAGELAASGGRRPKQRRRGHWRNVACGPQFAQHRWTWIHEYETRPDEPWDVPPTTILS